MPRAGQDRSRAAGRRHARRLRRQQARKLFPRRGSAAGATTGTAPAPRHPIRPAGLSRRLQRRPTIPAISFESAGADRQSIDAAADSYCAAHGPRPLPSSAATARASRTTAFPANARAAAAPAGKNYGNGAKQPRPCPTTRTLYDRQTLETPGRRLLWPPRARSAAFSGRTGSRVNYDCVPELRCRAPPTPQPRLTAPTVPSVTYRVTSDNGQANRRRCAAAYCSSQGRVAQFRRQGPGRSSPTTASPTPSQPVPDSVLQARRRATFPAPTAPTISYEAGQRWPQARSMPPAIRYCGMLGKSAGPAQPGWASRSPTSAQ